MKKPICQVLIVVLLLLLSACAIVPPKPEEVRCPTPIQGNTGKYMCPYMSDDVVAPWVDKGVNAATGAAVGQAAGAYVGQEITSKALGFIPFVGGYLGSVAGEAVGRGIAIASCGGWDYIKENSDLSFDEVDDMVVYMYARHGNDPNFNDVFKAVSSIYPEAGKKFLSALEKARNQ